MENHGKITETSKKIRQIPKFRLLAVHHFFASQLLKRRQPNINWGFTCFTPPSTGEISPKRCRHFRVCGLIQGTFCRGNPLWWLLFSKPSPLRAKPRHLRCPVTEVNGSMVNGSMDYFTYLQMVYWGYNPLILTIDPNFQRDIHTGCFFCGCFLVVFRWFSSWWLNQPIWKIL